MNNQSIGAWTPEKQEQWNLENHSEELLESIIQQGNQALEKSRLEKESNSFDFRTELRCPVCGSEMKEYVQDFQCRNRTSCNYIYRKFFQHEV